MADYEQMAKGFLSVIKDFGDIQAEKAKIQTDIMANEFKARRNFLWNIAEKTAEKQIQSPYEKVLMDKWQKEQQEQGAGQGDLDINSPKIDLTASGPSLRTPSARDKEFSIKLGLNQIKRMEAAGKTLNPTQQAFKDKYSGMVSGQEGKTLISPMITKISQNEDAYYVLGDTVHQLETNKDKFSQFMGPGKGALRHPVRAYVNKDLQDFLAWKANVQDAFQQYRVAITGAQASDKEIALLAKNRPTEDDNYDVFIKKAKEVRKTGIKVITRYIDNLKKAGYNTSGYQDTLDILKQELADLEAGKKSSSSETNITLPDTIQTTSQAVEYLTKQGMSKDEAINWLRSR